MINRGFKIKRKNFYGVIFDFDGVLAETVEGNFLVWRQVLAKYKIFLTKLEYCLLEGMSPINIARAILKSRRLPLTVAEEIAMEKDRLYLKTRNFRLYPEALVLIKKFKNKGIPMAIVSGASRQRFFKTFPKGLAKDFSVIITADLATKPKPNPQGFKLAVRKMSLQAKNCLVVENAPLGVLAAKRAGCFCVAVLTSLEKKYLQQADLVFKDLKTLNSQILFV